MYWWSQIFDMVIFGHSVGESGSVRPVESRRFKVVLCLCFPQSDQIFNISLQAMSDGQIVPTAFGLVWVRYWLRFWALTCTKTINKNQTENFRLLHRWPNPCLQLDIQSVYELFFCVSFSGTQAQNGKQINYQPNYLLCIISFLIFYLATFVQKI